MTADSHAEKFGGIDSFILVANNMIGPGN